MHICQLAYYVENAESAALEWANTYGAGPFFFSRNIPLTDVRFKGQPGALDHTSAYGWLGGHMIELVQQNCSALSVFTNRAYGLHHCAYFTPRLEAELRRLGKAGHATSFTAGTASGVQFAFVESRNEPGSASVPLGHYLEIYEDHPSLRQFYTLVEAAALEWDGNEPLREMTALSAG